MALLIAVLLLGVSLAGVLTWNRVQREVYPLKYSVIVNEWAAEYALDPYLLYAFIHTESSFRPAAESHAGARGLMQMTEDTFDWVKSRIAPNEALTFDDLYEPEHSVRFGSYFLSISLQRYAGDIPTAAAAYHSGWGTIDRLLAAKGGGAGPPVLEEFPHRQMAHYVNKINKSYQKYLDIYKGSV